MLASLLFEPLMSELLSLEVVQEALLQEVEPESEEEVESGRAGPPCRAHSVDPEPAGRRNVQPSPEDPPELLPGARAEKPEVPEGGLEEELLEEAGRL